MPEQFMRIVLIAASELRMLFGESTKEFAGIEHTAGRLQLGHRFLERLQHLVDMRGVLDFDGRHLDRVSGRFALCVVRSVFAAGQMNDPVSDG